jgi:hypothetical protein
MRNCTDCGTLYQPTGRTWRCLPCRRIWEREWRARRKADGRPVVTGQKAEPTRKEYYARPGVKERRAKAMRGYRNDPELRAHHQARWQVNRAVKAGRLLALPCEKCGEARAEAHHDDYTKPLDVRWLCKSHHIEAHAQLARAQAEAAGIKVPS